MPASDRIDSSPRSFVRTLLTGRIALAAWVAVLVGAWLVTLHAQGTWVTDVSLPSAIQEVGVASLNGQVYVVGGSVSQVRSNALQVFNPGTSTWSNAAPYPGTALDHIAVTVWNGILYKIGGLSAWPQPAVATVQQYDPGTNTWTALASLPVARGAAGAAAINGKIYVAGGLENGNPVADFTVYDIASNTWTTLANMPTARDHVSAAALNGLFYAIGGHTTAVCGVTTVEIYDPVAAKWSKGTSMNYGRAIPAIGLVNGHIQAFGGDGNSVNCGVTGAAEDFDPSANKWSILPDMPTPRHGTGGATINSSVYTPGGATASGDAATAVNERFDYMAQTLPTGWADQDIGSVGLPGGASYYNGVFTVEGEGTDIWGTADSFNFASQPLSGDGQIVARVLSEDNTNTYAKAGVMIRGALTAGAQDVILDIKPGGGLEFMTRSTSGGSTSFIAGATGSIPVWLKLVKSGTTITGYSSPDGSTWTQVGTTSVSFPTSSYIGLAVTSHSSGFLNTSTFDNVAVTTSGGSTDQPPAVSITSPTSGSSFTAGSNISIAANATDTDATPVASVAFYANNGTTNTLLGTDTASPYTFTWNNVAAGSYTLTAVATDTANLQTTSAPVSITVTSGGGGGGGGSLPSPWVDQDVGSVGLAGSASYSNGVFTVNGAGADIWGTSDSFNYVEQQLSGDGQIVARVVSETNTNTYAKAGIMFRNDLTTGSANVLLDVKPGGGLEFMDRASAGGSTSFLAGPAGSAPIWLKLVRSGNTFSAYSSPDGSTWTSIGSTSVTMNSVAYVGLIVCSHTTSTLMTATFDNVAASTSGTVDAAPTVSITSPTSGSSFTAGSTVSIAANATDTDATPVASVAFYANNGTTNTLLGTDTASPYTFSWTNVPAGSYTLTAVATDTANLQTTSAPVSITVTSGGGGGGLPSPWLDQDVGSVGLAGSASYSNGVFTVNGAGADIWGTSDSFNFLEQQLSGDGQIVARVVSLTNTNAFAKAGIMLRNDLTAGSANVLLDVKPGGGLEFMDRTSAGGSTAFLAGPTGSAPIWLKLVRSGNTFAAYSSPDGSTWTSIGSTTVTMSSTIYVGMIVCSHTTSTLMTATFDNVTVGTTSGGTDLPPSVSITSPTSGSSFTAGSNISIAANATDTDTTPVASVAFYANNGTTNTLLGTDTASPYTFTWSNVPAGSYTLTAVATDTANLQTTSAPVSITVTSGGGGGGGGALPSPWVDADVGSVGVAGSATYNSTTSTFTVNGAGSDIWGTSDSFNFVYQTLAGNGQITARVVSGQNTNTYAKVGVMIRGSLSPSDVSVNLDMTQQYSTAAGGGLEMVARTSSGASSSLVQGAVATQPVWVKLVRNGNTITGWASTDGVGWSMVNSTTVSGLPSTVLVGLVVCSHNTSVLDTGTLDNVSVATNTTVNNPITFSTKVLAAPTASGTAVGISSLSLGPTVVVKGPDGRLYVSVVNGKIFVLTLDQTKLTQAGQVAVTNVQEIDQIYNHPSLTCDSNGNNCQPSSTPGRQVTGMTFDPSSTASNLILYVSNSNYSTTVTSMAIYTYSGTITRLTLQPGTNNNMVVTGNQDLVVGLPRSRESHSTNGVRVGPDGWLYIAQGGNTNAGQPSSYFLNLPEYYLGASVLRLNLANLPSSLPIDFTNATASMVSGYAGVFEIYATGYRNPYDLTWHSNGQLYINVNSPNQGQGLTPSSSDGCNNTPSIDVGTPSDFMRLVPKGTYGGHPDPARGECVWGDGTVYSPPIPAQSNYLAPIGTYVRGWGDSSDGITEYTSNAFSGAIQHNLITTTFDTDNHVRRTVLTPDGAHVQAIFEFTNTFTAPLSVFAEAPSGNMYIADYTAGQIVLMIPSSPGQ